MVSDYFCQSFCHSFCGRGNILIFWDVSARAWTPLASGCFCVAGAAFGAPGATFASQAQQELLSNYTSPPISDTIFLKQIIAHDSTHPNSTHTPHVTHTTHLAQLISYNRTYLPQLNSHKFNSHKSSHNFSHKNLSHTNSSHTTHLTQLISFNSSHITSLRHLILHKLSHTPHLTQLIYHNSF